MRELELRKIGAVNQRLVQIEYKGLIFDEPLRFDVLVQECLLLELKSVQEILPIHKAQLLSYMKLLDVPLGLIINFHEVKLTDGLVRMILPGANRAAELLTEGNKANEGIWKSMYRPAGLLRSDKKSVLRTRSWSRRQMGLLRRANFPI